MATIDDSGRSRVWVRINAVRTRVAEGDLSAVVGAGVGIRVPKVESPGDLDWVAVRAGEAPLLATIETARGLAAAPALERHARHAAGLGFGAQGLVSPRQIATIHRAFSPGLAETAWAIEVLEAFDAAGGQATATAAGEFIDLPVARRAADVIAGEPAT